MSRPPFEIEGFIGQRAVLTPVLREQDGSLSRNEPMPHSLVIGPSGIGKTELFGALARRAKVSMAKLVGKVATKKVCETLAGLKAGDFVVFDEGHNVSPEVQEMLYEVIDSGLIPTRCLPDPETAAPAPVAPCTVVFSTDQPGHLLKALLARLPQRVWLADYSEDEMREIVARIATAIGVLLSAHAARLVARVSNGLPRRARDHVRALRRYFPDAERSQLGVPKVEAYLKDKEITQDGLTKAEIRYLRFLHEEGRASIETVAAMLGVDPEYVRTQVEQPLFYRKFVRIGVGGRSLTTAGTQRVQTLPAADAGEVETDAPVFEAAGSTAEGVAGE